MKLKEIRARLNRTMSTPDGEKYALVKIEKVGRSIHLIYEWLSCPPGLAELTTPKLRTKSPIGGKEAEDWINQLKSVKP